MIIQTGPTSIFPLRIDDACSSLADKSNSIKAGARGPTDTSRDTGRLAMSSSKPVSYTHLTLPTIYSV